MLNQALSVFCLFFSLQEVQPKFYLIKTAGPAKPKSGIDYTSEFTDPPPKLGKDFTVVDTNPSIAGDDYDTWIDESGKGHSCLGDMGSMDFGTPQWIEQVTPCASVTLNLGGNTFRVQKGMEDTSPVTLNGFIVSVEQYQNALNGETMSLFSENGDTTAELKTSADGTVTLDGKALTNVELKSVMSAG